MINFIIRAACGVAAAGWLAARGDQIALFYALDADWAAVQGAGVEAGAPVRVGGSAIARWRVGPHTVYGVRMGSGCVEAALAAQGLLSRFRCDRAVSVGPAGDLTGRRAIGTWLRVERVTAWQRVGDAAEAPRNAVWRMPDDGAPRPQAWREAEGADLVSGEAFIDRAALRDELEARHGAGLVDMNAFGVALACERQGVPLEVWRVVSDHADEAAAGDFRAFAEAYDGSGGRAFVAWLTALPPNPEAAASYERLRAAMEEAP